ncbi:MAG: DNA polymerase III subunit epsilon [Acidiferrobacteraceae bacterium]
MRQIVLDTETTGLEAHQGHRIIEIGCIEIVNRRLTGRNYHQFLNPDREIDAGAMDVHGLTLESLSDKPRFHEIAEDFLAFIKGTELIIHNAPFDTGFINQELGLLERLGQPASARVLDGHCTVLDTLVLAREMHPGQKNSLSALCKRYGIDDSHRALHGALLDAQILAEVYLAMTGGQAALFGEMSEEPGPGSLSREHAWQPLAPLPVVYASTEEQALHDRWISELDERSGGRCLWKHLST